MKPLQISPQATLPADTITDTVGIFGTRGAGKTSTAVVIVEEAYARNLPVVILDVKGDWWGLRSDRRGTGEGLPFIIFGGDHGDVPLEPTAGEVLADLVVDQGPDVILDLSDMSKTKQRSFATVFAERLYRRNREALLVVVDEADVLIPQRATNETARLVGAWDDIAKRGRGRGLGMVVVTQRPQDVAKSVLDEMHSLLLHATIGPRAVGAIKAWIADHDDRADSRTGEVLQSMRSMKPGECWLWAPQHEILQRTRIRRIDTFDSHATPKPGEARRQPKARASIDLDAVREQIAASVERAEANDPKALQAKVTALGDEILRLERELSEARAREPEHVEVEVSVLTPQDRALMMEVKSMLTRVVNNGSPVDPGALPLVAGDPNPPDAVDSIKVYAAPTGGGRPEPVFLSSERVDPDDVSDVDSHGVLTLPKAQKAILTVLRVHGTQSVANVAVLTGYSSKGGGFRNSLSALRTAGYITGSKDPLTITEAGADAVGPVPPLPRGDALREQWKGHHALNRAHGLILDTLAQAYPVPMTVGDVAIATGYEASGGGFRNAVSRLRSLGLIHGRDPLTIDRSLVNAR